MLKNRYLHALLALTLFVSPVFAEDYPTLPDPLLTTGGVTVDSTTLWEQVRRPEILELFRTHVYGRAPVGQPANMTFEVLESTSLVTSTWASAVTGTVTRKQIRVYLTADTNDLSRPHMDILIYLPNNQPGPVKLIMGLNFGGNHTIRDDAEIEICNHDTPWGNSNTWGRGSEGGLWDIESILNRGYGLATIHCADLVEDVDDGFSSGVFDEFDPPGSRPDDAWGFVGAWAWGLSRAMDYFETDQDIDHNRIAIMGFSRLGKAALWAGALDERFSLVISHESGCGGAALSRRDHGEDVKRITDNYGYWFCDKFKDYANNEDALPIDQHELMALMAPRPVYIGSASGDSHSDPEGEFLSGVHAAPVYALYGLNGLETTVWPQTNQPINDGHIGYHVRTGDHDVQDNDWNWYMDYADKHGQQISPPAAATNPSPTNGAIDVFVSTQLSWTGGAGVYVDEIFIGTSSPPATSLGTTTGSSISPGAIVNDQQYFWQVVASNTFGSTAGPIWSFTTGPPDLAPPTPNPASFASAPSADSDSAISMTATVGSDPNGVEYNFVETSGNPGGTNSDWQASPTYTDTGLSPGTMYTYTVQMRDSLGNTGIASASANATTDLDDYGSWELTNGLTPPSRLNDDDADGFTNEYEYFFGLDPNSSANVRQRSASSELDGGKLYPAITYTRRKDPGVTYAVEVAGDLVSWATASMVQVSLLDNGADGTETVTLRYNVEYDLLPDERIFLRVRATE